MNLKRLIITLIISVFSLYHTAFPSEPLAAYLSNTDSLWHVIDYKGAEMFAPVKAFKIKGYSEGMFRFLVKDGIDKEWMFVDAKGKIAFKPDCDNVGDFHEGYAVVDKYTDDSRLFSAFGFYDKTGKEFIPIKYAHTIRFSEGLGFVMEKRSNKYINHDGKTMIVLPHASGGVFSEGLASVTNTKSLMGYINKKGELQIPYRFGEARDFSCGLAAVTIDAAYGFINQNAELVIPDKFPIVGDFKENIAKVGKYNYDYQLTWGAIDKTGNVIIDYQFSFLREFSQGVAAAKKNDLWGFIDAAGSYIIEPKYFFAGSFINDMAWASLRDEGIRGYIIKEEEFQVVIPEDAAKVFDLRENKFVF
ncbi:MAG: WG repeat-containing protein [Candidatus Kapabacteria bacterium]|jgi:hypothetical protein|nr:WG repeat-containing protein [Candidatus Kapabacteria bacterium]